MNQEEILIELNRHNKNLQLLLSKFEKSDMLGMFLPTEYESEFKRIHIEIRDLLDEYFGDKNRYSNEIYLTVINKSGGFLEGISYSGVSDIIAIVKAAISKIPKHKTIVSKESFIHSDRIQELKGIVNPEYDLSRLIRLLEELNLAYTNRLLYVLCNDLSSNILDHIPPLFGFNSFNEVANNYGGKSFRGNMQHLQNSLRNIADNHLHSHIRKNEILPNKNQVNFTNDFDVLLSEITRLLK